MATVTDTLNELERQIQQHSETDYGETHRFCPGANAGELEAAEKRLGVSLPPSFREFLQQHGFFTLGEPDPEHDHLVFATWPSGDWRTALSEIAEQLGCQPVPADVADELGLEAESVAVLEQQIVIGAEGHEDFMAFDLRTRNPATGECSFGLVLFDDCEIEALAEEDPQAEPARGFDSWLARHIDRRA